MIKAIIQLLIGAIAIGFAPIFVKLLIKHDNVGPIGAGFWRMCIGSLGFALTIYLSSRRGKSRPSDHFWRQIPWPPLVAAGILFGLDLSAWHTSFKYTSIAASTLIANLSAIFVPLFGILFLKEPPRRNLILGGVIAFAGVCGLTFLKDSQSVSVTTTSMFWGEGLAFLTAFFYTGYMLCIKQMSANYNTENIMFLSSAISAIVLLVFCFVGETQVLPSQPIGWVWILCLGMISQFLGQGLVSKALSQLPVSQSAIILLSAPVSSSVFGWLIFGENLSIGQIISMIATLFGILLVSR